MAAWTYSDWRDYPPGSSARITRLRSHIKELEDKLKEGNTSTEGKSHDWSFLNDRIKELEKNLREEESVSAGTSSSRSVIFTRGKPIFPGGASV